MGCPPLQKKGGGYPRHLRKRLRSTHHGIIILHVFLFVLKFFSKKCLCEGGWKLKQ